MRPLRELTFLVLFASLANLASQFQTRRAGLLVRKETNEMSRGSFDLDVMTYSCTKHSFANGSSLPIHFQQVIQSTDPHLAQGLKGLM